MYKIHTIQRNSVHRVIGINKRSIPMTQITVDLINQQARQEGQPGGMIFGDINGVTALDDLEAAPNADGPEFQDDDADDRSYYLTSDDQSIEGDNDLGDSFEPIEEQYDLEVVKEDPRVLFEEEEDNDTLLEDLSDLDPPIEEDAQEPTNGPDEGQAETDGPPKVEEIDEEKLEP